MLVARRDPPFHSDANGGPPLRPNNYPPRASKFARFVTTIQMIGSLLAVPVGIASAYSFYRANFSPETTCQSLRSSIIALLDKSVDASTRRILVRRDVETFEKTCAAVDPDATAAFKTLLAAEKTAAPAAAPVATPTAAPAAPKVQRSEAPSKEPVRKPEPRPQTATKQPAANPGPAVSEPVRRDSDVSDTQWLESVRQALVTHKPDVPKDNAKPRPVAPPVVTPVARPAPQEAAPLARPAPQEAAPPAPAPPAPVPTTAAAPARPTTQEAAPPLPGPPPAPVPPTAVPQAPQQSTQPLAPALPRPITVMPAPTQRIDPDRPVPPESIPDTSPPASVDNAKPDGAGRSRFGKWISEIPLLGPVIENGRR
jgi:hypothetical protein